jgi:hypothetical protein
LVLGEDPGVWGQLASAFRVARALGPKALVKQLLADVQVLQLVAKPGVVAGQGRNVLHLLTALGAPSEPPVLQPWDPARGDALAFGPAWGLDMASFEPKVVSKVRAQEFAVFPVYDRRAPNNHGQ